MEDSPSCALSILVSRCDMPFMAQTIPHIARACRFPFAERMLVMDTAPLAERYEGRKGVGTLDELRALCRQLIAAGVMDRLLEVDYSAEYRRRVYARLLSRRVRETHDHRGGPILAYVYEVDMARHDYVAHFDSDILLHQEPGRSWIREGIDLLRRAPEVLSVMPLPGPPTADGTFKRRHRALCGRDPRGFYSHKSFASRYFLIDRRRFDTLLPLRPVYTRSKRERLRALLSGGSANIGWTYMVGKRMQDAQLVRADLDSPTAWALHPNEHGDAFVEALPALIERVERGWFPADQAGDFDLRLDAWLGELAAQPHPVLPGSAREAGALGATP